MLEPRGLFTPTLLPTCFGPPNKFQLIPLTRLLEFSRSYLYTSLPRNFPIFARASSKREWHCVFVFSHSLLPGIFGHRNRYDRTSGRSQVTTITAGLGGNSSSLSHTRHGGGDRPGRMEVIYTHSLKEKGSLFTILWGCAPRLRTPVGFPLMVTHAKYSKKMVSVTSTASI